MQLQCMLTPVLMPLLHRGVGNWLVGKWVLM